MKESDVLIDRDANLAGLTSPYGRAKQQYARGAVV